MEAGWSVEQLGGAKGRGVVARRAFKPGDLALEDRALAYAVIGSSAGSVCDCCLAPSSGPLRCSACKLVCYKSKEHQARAWRAGHREECAALRACAPRVPPTAVRLALRCALRHWRAQQVQRQQAQQQQAQQQQGQQDVQQKQQHGDSDDTVARYDELLQLQHHWDALSEGSKLQFAQMGALAHRLLEAAIPEAAEATSPRDLALLLARFGANSHTISDDELRPLAVGIFPRGALVNHACQPNTVHSFAGDRMLFRAVRAIQPGEEVTTSYTELAATRWERRRELLRHHQFDIDAAAVDEAASTAAAGTAAGAGSKAPETANGTTAAASSGGTTAGGPSAAALLFHPNQPPTVVLQMAGGSAELRLYSCQLPPWPHDKRDAALTAVVTAAPGGTANCSGSGSGSSSDIAAWGGMWGSLGLADEPSLTATPASASFDVAADLAGDEEPAAPGQQSSSAAGPSSASSVGQPAAAAAVHSWSAAGGLQHDGDLLAVQQLAAAYLEALQLQQSLDAMLAEGQAAAAVQRLQQSLAALAGQLGSRSSSSGAATSRLALGPRHVLRMRLLADLHRAAVAAEQWEAALAAAYELLPLYRQAYPAVWPQLGLLWAAVAKLEHVQERPERAMHAAEQALHILTTTHGGSGPAADAMRQVLLEARHESAMRGGGSGGAWRPALAGGAGSDSDE